MPPEHGNAATMTAMMRLLGKFRAWRRCRAARRRARLHSFMDLSDRTLADIGLRRADVYGALVDAVPLGQGAAMSQTSPCDAQICELSRRRALTVVANDLRAAA
jgi:uncharacterized protein YjiS (DUF1127 family)